LIFGTEKRKGIKLSEMKPEIVDLDGNISENDLWIHDEKDLYKAQILTRFFESPKKEHHFPRPFGVFFEDERPCYEETMTQQIVEAKSKSDYNLDRLLRGREIWSIAE
jgi:2-oxoglutarate ferredoxin oxidoreductase subunit beta